MPRVRCSNCGQDEGTRDWWLQRTRSIEKCKTCQDRELYIEKEKAATKEKVFAIEKEKAVAELDLKEKEISFEERKYEKDLARTRLQIEAQKAKDDSDHQKHLERKEELELKISALSKVGEIDKRRLEAEDRRLKMAQEIIQNGQDIDKVQSLLASLVMPSACFQPISVSDPKANSGKESPDAFSDIGNVNENIEDTDCPPPESEQ
uniref:Uncharacterized protein n=1 Tax=Amphimedon queenslandica TaxID=400682 RepID=A0A1X7TJW6_AMPQE